jgi:hypothetical protein
MSGWTTNGVAAIAASALTGAEQFSIDTEYAQGISPQSGALSLTGLSQFLGSAKTNGPNFRNFIDGGDFTTNPWQRGTSFSSIGSTLTYTADRWAVKAGSSAAVAVSQQALSGAIPGFGYALQIGRPSANSDTSTINLVQVMETADCYRAAGQVMTLSFWAKAGANFSAANSAINVQLSNGQGTNQSASNLIAGSWSAQANSISATATLTTSWQRFSFTTAAVVPAAATQLGILISFAGVGSAGANDWIQIAGVQLEVGAGASAFEARDVQVELEICQRYAFITGGTTGAIGTGAATSTTAAGFYVPFPVQMRAPPTTLTVATVGDLSVYTYANASVAALSALSFGSASVNGCHATATSTGLTSGTAYVLYVATALTGNVVFSADL